MRIGFLTGCLNNIPLKEKAEWASKNGFKALELSCWPRTNDRDYSGSEIDVANFTVEEAFEIKAYFKKLDLKISSLAYYDNNLDCDLEKRKLVNNHVKKCIDAASILGVELVGTFVGRDISKNLEENFDEFEVVFRDLVAYAESKKVKLMIENCPMIGWQVEGQPGTISYTPEYWDEMFKRVPSKSFGLNFDPSHLYFQLIDYIEILPDYINRIFHVHAKDAEILPDKLKLYGIFNKQMNINNEDYGFWRYRLPGLGQIEWKLFLMALKELGYNDVISIEHEDPIYEGTESRIKEGLIIGRINIEKSIR
ncbi:MAG TPA: sugar phosphate isomerase/epimerase [Clostridiaceae bacterium]